MEATIQTNNQAINIDINVSINVGALKANIQRGLQAMWMEIKQRCNIGTLTLPRLYRKELCLARVISKTIDAHPTLSNVLLWTMCAACFWAVLTYNFTTHI